MIWARSSSCPRESSGAADRARHAVRKIQEAARAAPASAVPPLRLAAAYERLAELGEPELLVLADRALATALALASSDRDVHLARLALAAKRGTLPALRAEYDACRGELPIAEECIRMIAALEQASAIARTAEATAGPSRWHLPAAGAPPSRASSSWGWSSIVPCRKRARGTSSPLISSWRSGFSRARRR